MGVGRGLYMYDVVVKSSGSLSHLLMSFLFFVAAGAYRQLFCGLLNTALWISSHQWIKQCSHRWTIIFSTTVMSSWILRGSF